MVFGRPQDSRIVVGTVYISVTQKQVRKHLYHAINDNSNIKLLYTVDIAHTLTITALTHNTSPFNEGCICHVDGRLIVVSASYNAVYVHN